MVIDFGRTTGPLRSDMIGRAFRTPPKIDTGDRHAQFRAFGT